MDRIAEIAGSLLLLLCSVVTLVFGIVVLWGVIYGDLHLWALAFNIPITIIGYLAVRAHLNGE